MLVSKEEYLSWIDNKKIHEVKKIEGLDYPYLYEFGIPEMLLDFIFFSEEMNAGSFLTDCYKEENYGKGFFKRHKSKIENYIVLCHYLGSKICLNSDKQLWKIDYTNFATWFVNENFDEFIKFWIILDNEIGKESYSHHVSVDHETVVEIEKRMKEIAMRDWLEYSFWQFLLECIDESVSDF